MPPSRRPGAVLADVHANPHATNGPADRVGPVSRRRLPEAGLASARRVPGPRTLALLVLLGGLWGLHIVFAKAIGAEGAREALALLILYISAAAFGFDLITSMRGGAFWPSRRVLRYLVVSSALGYLGPLFFELLVAPRIDASLFALIAGSTPLATVGIATTFGRDRLTPTLATALAAGTAAALVLLGPAAWQGSGGPAAWVALAFLVPLLYGAGDVYIEANWPRELDIVQVATGESFVATLWVVLLGLAMGLGPSDVVEAAQGAGWPAVGIVATALGSTFLYFSLINRAGAVFVSFASYVTIATGVIAGIVAFGERPGAALIAAALLIALALWLLNRDRMRAVA
jgi:drug/metabolite transporter (DMT)-like permease